MDMNRVMSKQKYLSDTVTLLIFEKYLIRCHIN